MELQPTPLLLALLTAALIWWLWQAAARPLRKSIASLQLLPSPQPEKQKAARARRALIAILLAVSSFFALASWSQLALKTQSAGPRLQLIVETGGSLSDPTRLQSNLRALRKWLDQAWTLKPDLELELHQLPEGSRPSMLLSRSTLEPVLKALQPSPQASSGFDFARRLAHRGEAVMILTDRPQSWETTGLGVLADLPDSSNIGFIEGHASVSEGDATTFELALRRSSTGHRRARLRSESLRSWSEPWISRSQKVVDLSEDISQLSWTETEPALAWRFSLSALGESGDDPAPADGLSADDQLILISETSGTSELRLWGTASADLERALQAIPGVTIVRAPPRDGTPSVIISKDLPRPLTLPLWWIAPPKKADSTPIQARWTAIAKLTPEPIKTSIYRTSPPSELGELEALLLGEAGKTLIARRGQGRSLLIYQGFDLRAESSQWASSLSLPVFATRFFDEAQGRSPMKARPGKDLAGLPAPYKSLDQGRAFSSPAGLPPGIYFCSPDEVPLATAFLDPIATRAAAFKAWPEPGSLLKRIPKDRSTDSQSLTTLLGLLSASALLAAASLQHNSPPTRAAVALKELRRIIARSWPGVNRS